MNNIILQPLTCESVSGQRFRLSDMGSQDYLEVSEFIAGVFAKAYGAEIVITYPQLISVRTAQGKPQAAMGIRGADKQALFLETYLDTPVEKAVFTQTGTHYPRMRIAEAGNLASTHISALKDMMLALSVALKQSGYEYALFTGTQSLKRYLEALGLRPKVYAVADSARLGKDASRWGRYYDTHPMVMGGTADEFYNALIQAYRPNATQIGKPI